MAEREGRRVVVEIRSVNHRFLDLKIRGSSLEPTAQERLESGVRDACQRGAVTATVRVERHGASAALTVDMEAAGRVHSELVRLSEMLDLLAPVDLELVCRQPGVLVPVDEEADAELVSECVAEAAQHALDGLVRMRTTEGELLYADLSARIESLAAITQGVAETAEDMPQTLHERLSERVGRLLETRGAELSADRLAQEIALLADRIDITEELVRLRSHIDHMKGMMQGARASQGAVGRKLDFLVQEMGREINTMGSKSQSADITRAVIEAKAELEKIREQVQNIE